METRPFYDLSVIIVNYNTAEFLVGCLNSIHTQSNCTFEVIVVDNASPDNSCDIVSNGFPSVKLITNDTNAGFSRANNSALRLCSGRYIYFLNPDTELNHGVFSSMVDFMEAHKEIGLAGTGIINPDGSFQPSVELHYPGQRHAKRELKGLKGDIAWVLGASMIARREVLMDLGGFDEGFFLYGEDLDLCIRVRKRGWGLGFIPDAVIVHWGGQSERNNLPVEVWGKKLDSEMLFYKKHYSKATVAAIKRENILHALWRVMTLKLSLPFSNDRDAGLKKLEKYNLVLRKSSL
ncbi:MAG: glycosyltransferase family 2 protein [Deltaproteobacteria bacterium]|nr:glycosyltransferase family 2 protein [Deltaproteobacteria bacterium]